jgi:hypothetical protein
MEVFEVMDYVERAEPSDLPDEALYSAVRLVSVEERLLLLLLNLDLARCLA